MVHRMRLVLRHIDKQGLGTTGFASMDYDLLGCTNTGKASGTPVFLRDKALAGQLSFVLVLSETVLVLVIDRDRKWLEWR
jgi:hypothetical protein